MSGTAGMNPAARFMRTILLQLDTDSQPSVFDRVVALDAGADEVLSYGGVTPAQVRDLVQGAIFTRAPGDLKRTAVFIGGSDLDAGEALLREARKHLLPQIGLTVSLMLDARGANTTAAAVLRAARQQIQLRGAAALVLGTGPVGRRVARLLAGHGAEVRVGSERRELAEQACAALRERVPGAKLEPAETATLEQVRVALADRALVVAAGPQGVTVLPGAAWSVAQRLKVAIDLNAVPPAGIEDVQVGDKATERDGVICFGAFGVGGGKMKIHRAAIERLFERNDLVLDAEELDAMGQVVK